jgi:amino-acid N-acetyltransferase
MSMLIRSAEPRDAAAILDLFAVEVAAGRMLPRRADDIVAAAEDWVVAEDGDGTVVACGSLVDFGDGLGEVRSLAVAEAMRGGGIGARIVDGVAELAKARGLRRLLALTRRTGFFERLGFVRDQVASFPAKVWRDCTPCPFRERCDEVALVLELEPAHRAVAVPVTLPASIEPNKRRAGRRGARA